MQDPKKRGKNTEASRKIFDRNVNVDKLKKSHNQVSVWFDHFYLANPDPNSNPNPCEIKQLQIQHFYLTLKANMPRLKGFEGTVTLPIQENNLDDICQSQDHWRWVP